MIARKLHCGLLLVAVTLLGACSSDMDELQQYIAQVKARKSTKIDPIPQIKQYEAFAYVAGDRREPFTPSVPESARNGEGVRPDMSRNREPLEEFPLDALKMVGLIDYNKIVYALVRAPDGVIHRVSVGNYIGQNFGKITRISESEISLDEIVPDGFGGFKEQPASLAADQK
ncbi:pilus assembly protein PilP [Nevskia soli]|uniref:pilus assembly protein PilP n=1 Tax=Nevskia soli TaxID=418856 RepID=UPI0004A71FE6|nr:pilus assembly protein PilP [Nevskia soli]